MIKKFAVVDPLPMLINRKYTIKINTDDYPDVDWNDEDEVFAFVNEYLIPEYNGPMDETDREVIDSENYHDAEWEEIK